MTGNAAPEPDSDYGFSLTHQLLLASLLGAMALAFNLTYSLPPESSPSSAPVSAKDLETQSQSLPSQPTGATDELIAQYNVKLDPNTGRPIVPPKPYIPRPVVAPRPEPLPIPEEPVVVAAVAEKPVFNPHSLHLQEWKYSEVQLELYLGETTPTIGLDFEQAKHVRKAVLTDADKRKSKNRPESLVLAQLEGQSIAGLPFQDSENCELKQKEALELLTHSRMLNRLLAMQERIASHSSSLSNANQMPVLDHYEGFNSAEAIPAMVQVVQPQPESMRRQLVEKLATTDVPESTQALVARAVYDLSETVRTSANNVLKQRPQTDYRAELLAALRYPFSPVAWHAAESLIAVNDREAVPLLIGLLDAPNPTLAFPNESGEMVVRELVRVNHMQNCLLCHAVSQSRTDLVSARVPSPGEPLQPVYYSSRRSPGEVFVRADVTYLRQDFSVMHDVAEPRNWPDRQRFDYFVRTRPATSAEIAASQRAASEHAGNYPQRQAILHALRKLTGKNAGPLSENWRQLKL